MIADLATTGRSAGGPEERPIEPAQLQIVCDTVWRRSAERNGSLTLDDYLRLATPGHGGTVAQQILDLRLAEQLEQLEKHELELLDRMLDKLRTDRGTKWVREVNELADAVGATRKDVRDLLQRLQRATWSGSNPADGACSSSWFTTTLPKPLGWRASAARSERPAHAGFCARRVRAARCSAAMRSGRWSPRLPTSASMRPTASWFSDRRSAMVFMEPVLPVLEASGAPVWELFAERIEKGDEAEAAAVIESLSALRRPEAADVLVHALERPELAARIISLLGYAEHTVSVDLLASALPNDEVRADVLKALARLTRPYVARPVAARARSVVVSFYKPRLRDPSTASAALAELSGVASEAAVQLAAGCLRDKRLRPDAIRCLAALARSSRREVATAALDVLRAAVFETGDAGELTREKLEALPLSRASGR